MALPPFHQLDDSVAFEMLLPTALFVVQIVLYL